MSIALPPPPPRHLGTHPRRSTGTTWRCAPALAALALGAGTPAWAQQAPVAGSPASSASPAAGTTDQVLEATRRSVRSSAEWLARGVDSWFGDRPFKDGGQVSDGRLSLGYLHRQDDGSSVTLRFNARFRLPNLEQRAYVFVGRDNPREVITDKPGAFSRQQRLLTETRNDQRFLAGLGLSLHDRVDLRVGFRGGLKPYAQARYRQPFVLGPRDIVDFRQTLFWTVDDHFGSTTALSWEHALSSNLALRWLNAATITQEKPKFDWSTSIGAYRAFPQQRLLSLELLLNGLQGSGVNVADYGVQAKWEQPVHKDWLIGELIVGHFWPRQDAASERTKAWALGAGLKLKF